MVASLALQTGQITGLLAAGSLCILREKMSVAEKTLNGASFEENRE